jgi:hypothetical protein
MSSLQKQQRLPRAWYLDALSSIAYFVLALVVGKAAGRLGPFAALFSFGILGGLGWLFARSAWRGLLEAREGK